MLIHPWDAARDDDEWRAWLATRDFGQLAANGPGGGPPVVVPTHFLFDAAAGEVLLHLARPNPVWAAIERDPAVLLSVHDDYAYIPGSWRTGDPETGVPTSYYASVQLACRAEVVDDPEVKAEILRRQLAHFQPDGAHGVVAAGEGPYRRQLPGLRGLRLTVVEARAKFKYDGRQPVEVRERVAGLLAERGLPGDAGAREQQLRRMAER